MYKQLAVFLLCGTVFLTCCHRKKPASAARSGQSAGVSEDRSLAVTEVSVSDPDHQYRLRSGFYEGSPAWKWTGQRFAVTLDKPEWNEPTYLVLDFTAPVELMDAVKTVVLTGKVNGVELGKTEYKKDGHYRYSRPVPDHVLQRSPAEVEFSLDKTPPVGDGHPQGLIVLSVSFQPEREEPVDRELQVRMARAGYQKLLAERNRQLPADKQAEMMKLFHNVPIWQHMWFHSVQIEKNPLDLWMMQDILYQVQPDFIIETGTWRGGSALYWAHVLNDLGLEKSRVFTADIQDLTQTAAQDPIWKKYVTFFLGSSTDPKIVAEITRQAQGHKVVVTLDSDHTARHVLNELHAYAPLVSHHSYLIVEDTHIDGVPTQPDFGPGPLAAVQKFLAEGGSKDFEQDFTREAFIMTFNPGGWLRRK